MIRVVQMGNAGVDGGGISAVLEEYSRWPWSRSEHRFWDTYATDPRLFGLFRLIVVVKKLLGSKDDIDVAQIHLSQKGSFVREGALVWLARRLGLRVVVTVHGSSFVSFSQRHARVVAFVLRRADVVTVLSEAAEIEVRRLGVSSVVFVPNSVGEASHELATESFESRRTVVFAGVVSRRKGADVLMEAWSRITSNHPDAELVLYGPWNEGDVLPDLPVRTVACGSRPRAQVREAMRNAILVVLPSRAEAFPMSILEAMSVGVPVLMSRVGGASRLVDDEDQLVDPGDVNGLAIALDRFLTDREVCSAKGQRNLDHYARSFTPAVVSRKLEQLYAD